MPREEGARPKRRDERWETLKRRIQLLSRLDGATVTLVSGPAVASIVKVSDADAIVKALRAKGALDQATFEAAVVTERPLVPVTAALLATAQRDLRAVSIPPARALAREHKKALARYGEVDEAWLRAKRDRISALSRALTEWSPPRPEGWFEGAVDLVRAAHGDASAAAIAEAGRKLAALGRERRRTAEGRIEALASALETGAAPADAGLVPLVERLDRARDLPGRARRKAVIEALRGAIAWAEAPADDEALRAVAEPLRDRSFEDAIRSVGRSMVQAMPSARDPAAREKALELLAFYGLAFRVGDDGVPLLSSEDVEKALAMKSAARDLTSTKVTLAQALAVVDLKLERHARVRVAKWIAEGLEIDLVARACAGGHGEGLASVTSMRAARAYATWATRLVPHYASLGIEFKLSPELFLNLPKNEDLGVLAICLMEQTVDGAKAVAADPIAVLDSTLGLFQKLPGKASGVLSRLRGTDPGAGRRAFPDLAAWLDDDALLDRYMHITHLAGVPSALTKRLREDFDHAGKASRERAHLEGLPSRSDRQEARLAVLRARDRSLSAAPRSRTRRRIVERIEQLLPIAYRRELDAAFREILRDAWGIAVPSLTQAWRDAVRFWLVVDDNRDLLGRLLRACAASPGRDVKPAFAKNREWIAKAARRFDVSAWLAPRRDEIVVGGRRWVVALEEDPLEVLRMGIPFGTCLALDSGCNAASTVLNAIDANKRVLYVRAHDTGRVVARKLLAVTKEHRLVGYRLYLATRGDDAREIGDAVARMCRAIAEETGLAFATTGEPETIHEGFWYDDGAVAFDVDADVAEYCRAIGLAPPATWYESLATEARGHAAMERNDVEAALATLTRWNRGPANRRLGAFVVDRLGATEAARRAEQDPTLAHALVTELADGEDGMVRALGFAPRLADGAVADAVDDALGRFPPSPRIARALVDMAARVAKAGARITELDLVDRSRWQLARFVTDVAGAFDLLDAVAPAWEAAAAQLPCSGSDPSAAADRVLDACLAAWRRSPDEASVVACLMSRRRSRDAHRVALGIAARHRLDGGARALVRFASLRPDLAETPQMLAAILRQEDAREIPPSLARRLPRPAEAPFEALGDLVVAIHDWGDLLARFAPSDLVAWAPGPWEAAWYRRHLDHPVFDELFAIAARAPAIASYAHEQLASLGDVVRLSHVRALATSAHAPREKVARASRWKTETECLAVARSVAAQVAATSLEAIDLGRRDVIDAAFAWLARDVLLGRARGDHDLAGAIVAQAACFERAALASELLDAGADDAAALVLAQAHGSSLSPRTIALAWSRGEPVKRALLTSLVRASSDEWTARAWAAERAAGSMGLSADGLLEEWALAFAATSSHAMAVEAQTPDQQRSVIRAFVERADPLAAATFYADLPDELSASWFLRALSRVPRDRAAAIREAAARAKLTGTRGASRKAWLAARSAPRANTGLQKPRSSPIEHA